MAHDIDESQFAADLHAMTCADKKPYNALCTEPDCFRNVKEDDIERDAAGRIYERSKKCWDCRTDQDRTAIKRWRKNQRRKAKGGD